MSIAEKIALDPAPDLINIDIERLKDEIFERSLNFKKAAKGSNKEFIRELHQFSKSCIDKHSLDKAKSEFLKLKQCFINGSELRVSRIKPILLNVDDSRLYKRLFKLIRHTWSMPYSKGYGRRLRFLVWDEGNNAVMGIIGLQSPPADLECRDRYLSLPKDRKLELVNRTMDVYILGSVPPYSNILGGKLVAGLVSSDFVREVYWNKYAGKHSQINGTIIKEHLLGATTTSAYGRSSIYNRLRFNGKLLAKPIGYTKGYGSIHLEPVLEEITNLLKSIEKYHGGGYGKGPKSKWQNISRALKYLGLDSRFCLNHGLRRQVFLYDFSDDLRESLTSRKTEATISISTSEYAEYWLNRWAIPRSERFKDWKSVDIESYMLENLQ